MCAQHSQVVRNGPARRRSSDRAKGRVTLTGDVIWQYVSAYLLAASRCNRLGSQLNVRAQPDFRFVPIQLSEGRPLAEQLCNSVHVTVSTICRISFCAPSSDRNGIA